MLSDLFVNGLRLSESIHGEESYIKDLPVVKGLMRLRELKIKSKVTFFVGENGTGKSTLLEAMAVGYGFNWEVSNKNFPLDTKTIYSPLHQHLVISKGKKQPSDGYFLRAESIYNIATEVDRILVQNGEGEDSRRGQSHGESFISLVLNRFAGNGLYLLDEPEAALSPNRQMELISHIHNLIGIGSQFFIATHSPILLSFPGAEIFVLSEEGMERTPYTETEHYILTKAFLDDPTTMLKSLFED